ncbi:MAG: N-formylglutamate amidohydrolase [Geminicoccaceae bacterium]
MVLSLPHSGTVYAERLSASFRLPLKTIRKLEDPFLGRLFAFGSGIGAWSLATRLPRAFVDLNRSAEDMVREEMAADTGGLRLTPSSRGQAGLGVVPTRVEGKPLYKEPLAGRELQRRLVEGYWPYHNVLATYLDQIRHRFGQVLLIDCHSMPSSAQPFGASRVDIALGDRYGKSADPVLVEALAGALAEQGLKVARNRPYAGGAITRRYGAPADGRHAIQIEIDRRLYMDEQHHVVSRQFRECRQRLRAALAQFGRDLTVFVGDPEPLERRDVG